MCGIITAVTKTASDTGALILDAYSKQYARGSQGFGFVSLNKSGTVHAYKRAQTIEGIRKALNKHGERVVMFHHRLPTSTPNVAESNHPIHVTHKALRYDYYVIHNGVISNADERYKAHTAIGYKYSTALATGYQTQKGKWYYSGDVEYNDSEALAIDLAMYLEGASEKVQAKGASAYVVLQVHKRSRALRRLWYGRNNGNTLYVARHNGALLISSQDVTGKGKLVREGTAYGLNSQGKLKQTVALDVPTYSYTSTYGYGYSASTLWQGSALDKYTDDYKDRYTTPQKRDEKPAPDNIKLPTFTDEADDIDELEDERDMLTDDIAIARQCLEYCHDLQERQAYAQELDDYTTRLKEVDDKLVQLYSQAPTA
jgi:predicted glutamine amidotransferase